jgi:hypothetical protein
MKFNSANSKLSLRLALLLASFVFLFAAAPVLAKTEIEEVKESADTLVSIKDSDNLSPKTKEEKKFAAAKDTLRKILGLSIAEVKRLQDKLDELEIEKLVASDYTFDAAEVHEMLSRMLDYYLAYYDDMGKRLDLISAYEEARNFARDLKTWREKTYLPGVERLLALDLVLRNKNLIGIADARFEKILNDLRKLKNSKLITFESLDEFLMSATGNLKSAAALDEEATNLLIRMLKSSTLNPAPGNDFGNSELASLYRRINNLVDQSLTRIKNAYRQFLEINTLVKKMVGVE